MQKKRKKVQTTSKMIINFTKTFAKVRKYNERKLRKNKNIIKKRKNTKYIVKKRIKICKMRKNVAPNCCANKL